MGIKRYLRKSGRLIVGRIPLLNRMILASADYRVLSESEAHAFNKKHSGWSRRRSVLRQERAYEKLLFDLRNGSPRIDFQVAAAAAIATGISEPTILEVGCGNGYYSEVFRRLVPGASYVGADYSQGMVASAKAKYPKERFLVEDGTNLTFGDSSFDIVFNGVSLMHILEYRRVIKEAARVANSHAIFHSVPVFDAHSSTYFRKYAYGTPVVEIVFNRKSLEQIFAQEGLTVIKTWPSISYDVGGIVGARSYSLTYLCGKGVSPREVSDAQIG